MRDDLDLALGRLLRHLLRRPTHSGLLEADVNLRPEVLGFIQGGRSHADLVILNSTACATSIAS